MVKAWKIAYPDAPFPGTGGSPEFGGHCVSAAVFDVCGGYTRVTEALLMSST